MINLFLKKALQNNYTITTEGQSNELGVAYISQLSSITDPFDFLQVFERVFIFNESTNTYEHLQIGVNNQGAYTGTTFGTELGIAQRFTQEILKGNLYIQKNGLDGMPIANFSKGTSGYTKFLNKDTTSDSYFLTNSLKVIKKGFVWIQGESNTASTESYYNTTLTQLLNDKITDKMITNQTVINLTQISTNNLYYSANVANAKTAVASAFNAKITTYSNNYNPDNLHLNTIGQLQLGYDAFEVVFNKPHKIAQ